MSGDLVGFQPGGRAPAPPPLDLVQDFVNTEIPEWARDDISTPDALGAWFRGRGLIDEEDGVDAETFVAARALRDLLRELALLNTLERSPDARTRADLDRIADAIDLRVRLDVDGTFVVDAGGRGGGRGLAAVLAHVLRARALGTWPRLKACQHETCGWLFYDGSRNASSRWCSMSICGNRSKTAAYRRRMRAP